MGLLVALTLENFKSFKGSCTVGPFASFSAVIGPNGSGKSNLMDAISFVLGEKTANLRVKRIGDLIYGAPVGKPVSNRCQVKMTYRSDDGKLTVFARSVIGSSAEYRIDNEVVSHVRYVEALENINIFIRARNFLVFQGAVESVALKTPKELTQLFEEISRSGELKDDYERAKAEMMRAEENTQMNYQKKRGIAAERRVAKMEKEEAEKYQKMRESLTEKQKRFHLIQLYRNDRETERQVDELKSKQKEQNVLVSKCSRLEEHLREKRKHYGKALREVNKLEQLINEQESDITRVKPNFIKVKENVRHSERKLKAFEKACENARRNVERHNEQLEQLEAQLQEVVAQREAQEAALLQEPQIRGRELSQQQLDEYNSLKGEVVRQCAAIQQELTVLVREQQMDQELIDNDKRCQHDFTQKVKQKETELDALHRRLEKLNDSIQSTQNEIREQQQRLLTTEQEVSHANSRLEQVILEVDDINRQLNEANVDTSENSRLMKKQELVENLKRVSTGVVYGRLVDLCQPVHKRYLLAVTKVLGNYMNAIITDTEKTARECIRYMKEQRIEPETFLPLDYIDVRSIDERLREIKKPRNVKLVIDVVHYEPAQIKRALQFACGNALVCETVEDARTLAFCEGERHKTVSLDGTLFHKSGVISGGTWDLKARARRWDEKAVAHLRAKKESLAEEYKELHRTRRKESAVTLIQNTITQLEKRIKYMLTDKENTEKRLIRNLEVELVQMRAEVDKYGPRIKEVADRMSERQVKIVENQERMDRVADQVFADFCVSIGVSNVRQYEEQEVRLQQVKRQQLMENDNQIEKLKNELEFQKSEDCSGQLGKIESSVIKEREELQRLRTEEAEFIKKIGNMENRLEELRAERVSKKTGLEEEEVDVSEAKKEVTAVQKELLVAQKQIAAIEASLEQKRLERHSLLQACVMQDVKLPLIKGTWDLFCGTADGLRQSQNDTSSAPSEVSMASSLTGARQMFEQDALIQIDYSTLTLDDGVKFKIPYFTGPNVLEDGEIRFSIEKLKKEISELQDLLDNISVMNVKATERLEGVRERFVETSEEFEAARRKAKAAKLAFEKVKKERCERFNRCFELVSEKIDEIYKVDYPKQDFHLLTSFSLLTMSRNQSAQAYLNPDNPEEPYLEGIMYNCVAPGKRFRPLESLSGGEKTLAALALLFAIRSFNSAPFFVLDEVDAALDNTNIGKVAAFIREQAETNLQIIVISLKEEFYSKADRLIGICSQAGQLALSRVLTLDLSEYEDTTDDDDPFVEVEEETEVFDEPSSAY
ncbi:structural maintenance of chromosomes protein [Trichuris trichiura]|uniref:Structural maintenance of chromosomes protein n=1 Tax=Trichuris trichiura TaxID=36087 RepID=A0A077Z8I7_TRITR|nr:structural maintenance of chromosomes protein [Trichuris trichiura]